MSRLYRTTATLLAFLFAQVLFSQTVSYTSHDEVIPNPERGLYHHTEVHSGSYNNLNKETLTGYRTEESITQILRVFYLEQFRSAPISDTYLNNIRKDFTIARAAGIKVIVRFAYSTGSASPYNDATPEVVQMHIGQLKPILRENADVIAVMQAGFVGTWGEWYYTDHFSQSPGQISAENWEDRRQVVYSLLDALPADRMVQIRTPGYKMTMFDTEEPIDESIAFEDSYRSRTGHHNDCFVASSSDFGTYVNPSLEKPYLEAETFYTPMGGETCALAPPYSDCDNSVSELERFHWSYLNIDYNRDVLNDWDNQGCFDEIKLKLGYRYELTAGTFSTEAKPGGAFEFDLNLQNNGYSNPYNPRILRILLRNQSTGTLYYFEPNENIKTWLLSTNIDLTFSAGLPAEMPTGSYDLLLHMPDPYFTLKDKPAYAIQMANVNVWEPETGYNNLHHTVTITNNETLPDYMGSSTFSLVSASTNSLEIEGSDEIYGGVSHDAALLYWSPQSVSLTRVIEQSEDGENYRVIASLPANEQYYLATNLSAGTTHTFRYYLTDGVNNTQVSSEYTSSLLEEEQPLDISVNGIEDDWQTIPPLGTGYGTNTYAIKIHFDSENLYLNMRGTKNFRIYINADNNLETGYSGDSTKLQGMDYQITNSGIKNWNPEWKYIAVESSGGSGEISESSFSLAQLELFQYSTTIPIYGIIDDTEEILNSDGEIATAYKTASPDLPEVFEVTNSTLSPQTKVILTWSECKNCTGYLVEKSTDGSNFQIKGDYRKSVTETNDENLTSDTEYFYRMQTYNDEGKSNYSEVISIRTKGVLLNTESKTLVYPNPTEGIIYLNHEYDKVTLTDLTGKIVLEKVNSNLLNLMDLKQGVYLLKSVINNQEDVIKVIKQ